MAKNEVKENAHTVLDWKYVKANLKDKENTKYFLFE